MSPYNADEMARVKSFDRGAPVDEPMPVRDVYASKGKMHCACGATFTVAQFDAWEAHDCSFRRAAREGM